MPGLARPKRCSVPPRRLHAVDQLGQDGVGIERAGLDRLVDPHDVHVDDAPCAEVEVADLAVAHLAHRQPDIIFGCADQRPGRALVDAVEVRRACHPDGVSIFFSALAIAVEDDEDDARYGAHGVNFNIGRHAMTTRRSVSKRGRIRASVLNRSLGIGLVAILILGCLIGGLVMRRRTRVASAPADVSTMRAGDGGPADDGGGGRTAALGPDAATDAALASSEPDLRGGRRKNCDGPVRMQERRRGVGGRPTGAREARFLSFGRVPAGRVGQSDRRRAGGGPRIGSSLLRARLWSEVGVATLVQR